MDNKKLSEKKQELMKPDWTENLHHELQELPLQEAKWIVENMTDSEIFSKVNNRRFQEDYIADYIEPTRDFEGVERLRQLAYENIDSAMALGLEMSLEELRQSGIEPHGATVSALAWYGKDKV